MTARFAGSRTLDERRRRWLATNEAERTPPAEKPPKPQPEELPPEQVNLRQFPVRKVISPKGWKIALACLAAAGLGFLIIASGAASSPGPFVLGPGWHRLMDGTGGRLARQFEAGLLMLGGQLAFFIWWGRCRSLRDFDGQYRIWLWAAFLLMFAGWGLVGDWHWAFSDTLCWLWSARFPQREIVCWMFPSALVAGILWRKLCADMRGSKCSFFLMGFAGLGSLSACVFRLGIDRTGWPSSTRQLAGASLEMSAAVGVFASLLVHARYVLHVSPEPPENRPSLWARVFGVIVPLFLKLPRPRLAMLFKLRRNPKAQTEKPDKKTQQTGKQKSRPTTAGKIPKPEEPKQPMASTKPEPKPATKPALPEKQSAPAKPNPSPSKDEPKPTVARTNPAAKETPAEPGKPSAAKLAQTQPEPSKAERERPAASHRSSESERPAASHRSLESERPGASHRSGGPPGNSSEAHSNAEEASSEPQLRGDAPLDPGQLKGLSKKERRKLRKQHRDTQRQDG